MSDQITLTLPAAPEFVRVARLTGAGLATRAGMGYDEVEDLRIAVGEACSLLIGPGNRSGTLTLTFGLEPDAINVEIIASLDGTPRLDDDGVLSDQILAAVADHHRVERSTDRVWVTKRHAVPAEPDPS